MQKIKLFLLLALLVAGVSGAWATTREYSVVYTGRTTTQGAGYEIINTQVSNNTTITSGNDAPTVVLYRNSSYNNPTALQNNTIGNYIRPRVVENYDAAISLSGTTITIAYSPKTVRYRVLYEMATLSGTGYTLTGTNPQNGRITSAADATVLEIQKTGTAEIATLTTENVGNYISARQISGYTTSYYVNTNEAQLGYLGNIYINYVANTGATVTSDDVWDYSNQYYRTTGSVINLPADECAISLHLNDYEEVSEQKTYKLYRNRTTEEWNGYNVYFLYDYYNGEYVKTNWFYYGTNLYNINVNKVDFNNLAPVNENGTRLNRTTTTITNEDGLGHDATYTYESVDDAYWYYDNEDDKYLYRPFTYSVTHTIGIATHTDVTIPAYSPDGRKVVAIQKWGLCYKQEDIEIVENCVENPDGTIDHGNIKSRVPLVDDHSNLYLKTVTFESPSNLKSIGDYAFMSCKELVSVDIPNTVEFLGQGAFEMDTKLKNVNFQTLDDGTIKIKTIKNFTFWLCTAMETLYLPDGITEIEGQQSGASLQYMTSLINLRLPNTLERIGPHFLCSASSLKTLTIPNSVVYIDGASFHGCESLESVYILGPAANLQGEYAEGNSGTTSSTFSANETLCKEAVNHCTFYTTDDNLQGYQNDPVWSRINENGVYNPSNGLFGNTLTTIPSETRVMPTTWVTALFPQGVGNYEETFGENTLVAIMKECTSFSTEVINGKATRVYDLTFELLDAGVPIPENKPVLIKAGQETEYEFFNDADKQEDWWKNNSTEEFPYGVTAPDGAVIQMKGQYISHQLQPWDFYFMYKNKQVDENGKVTYPDEPAKFYRVPDQQNAATIKACRCWWTINVNNMRAKDTMAKTFQDFFDDETTKVKDVEDSRVVIGGIYDLQGRKLDIDESELPQGLYIVNGKKMVVK